MCDHRPSCPPAEATDRDAAAVLASHPEQGWSLLCNGVIAFDDGLDLLPTGSLSTGSGTAVRASLVAA